MKKMIAVTFIIVIFLQVPVFAQLKLNDMLADVKMILAEGEPRFTDNEIVDYLILSIQSVSAHGFACFRIRTGICNAGSFNFKFADYDPTECADGASGLFIRHLTKDRDELGHHSIWEIEISSLGRKEIFNPPEYQYFSIYHQPRYSWFSPFGVPITTDTVEYVAYVVPLKFGVSGTDTIVNVSHRFRVAILDHTLFLCYVSIHEWTLAWDALNNYLFEVAVSRELEYNRLPDATFGIQIIEE